MIASESLLEQVAERAKQLRMEPMEYLYWRAQLRADYAETFRRRRRPPICFAMGVADGG